MLKKARLISHLSELDNIRRDEYMPQDVVEKVIELEKLLTNYLTKELEEGEPVVRTRTSSSSNHTFE
jgi:hypothetical protein